MEKSAIFIDGGYLNRILKDKFKESRIDYEKLSNYISKTLNLMRLRTYYYYCTPIVRKGNKKDEKRAENTNKFIQNLRRLPRFDVKLGRLQLIGDNFKQKMVDVLMSLDIVDMSFDKQIDHAVIIAGDSDFIPAIKKAKDCGAIIHLFYHPSSIHDNLLDHVDERYEINDGLIKFVKN
jgi:uncharacterized LabA/DUF88 family protein